jgi:DNA helicase-2/ATP-dependent DNA helicase PcrA
MNFNQELTKLNPQQLAAVVTNDVPLRIIAGAGSGKTRVITMKIAYLIKQEHIRS